MECSISECTRPAQARTWCGTHYMRWHTTGTTDLVPRKYNCGLCGTAFQRDTREGHNGPNKFCTPKCRNRYQIVVNKYHLTVERYRELISAGCSICGATGDLEIDHDHGCCPDKCKSCGECVRGALCGDCNRGLGLFRERPDLLARAAVYVREQAMSYPMHMPVEDGYPGSIPDYSPHQWQSHDVAGPGFTVSPASAVPDVAAANAAVAAAGGNRSGGGVLDVPNMSYPGEHELGEQ